MDLKKKPHFNFTFLIIIGILLISTISGYLYFTNSADYKMNQQIIDQEFKPEAIERLQYPLDSFEDYKIENYNNILIAGKKVISCEWKPDIIDDGYKICNAEVIIWNRKSVPININWSKQNFDFKLTRAYKNGKLNLSYSTNYSLLNVPRLNENVSNETYEEFYNVSDIVFNDWKPLDNLKKDIPANKIVSIKINFEIPRTKSASYNLTYLPGNLFLDPDIDVCGTLSTPYGVYTQNGSIVQGAGADCIKITAENITFIGNGYSITSGQNVSGIYSNQFNTTIKGTNISMGIGTGGMGIELITSAFNSTIINSIITGNNYGIAINDPKYVTIYNNTINGSIIYGIRLDATSTNINITENLIINSLSTGIRLVTSSNNIIFNNTIIDGGITAILISSSSNNTISNNIIKDNLDIAINLATGGAGSDNNIIENNYMEDNGDGLYLSLGNNNSFNNNVINNSGVYAIRNDDNNYNFFNNTVIINNNWGIRMHSGSNSVYQNTIFSANTMDIQISGGSINNSFINASYSGTETVDASSELIRKWWYIANVTDSSDDSGISGALVEATNSTGASEFSINTNADGRTNKTAITEYDNVGGSKTYYSNFTINASASGGFNNLSQTFNASGNNLNHEFSMSGGAPVDNPPVTTLSLPANNTNYDIGTKVNISCNATDDSALQNVTLYIYNSTGDNILTNSTNWTGTSNSTEFVYNFSLNDTYLWNCLVFDNASQSDWATANWTVNISTSSVTSTIDALFSNTTFDFKNVYDEGEEFLVWINWSDENNQPLNDTVGECNITLYNITLENASTDTSFTLCDAGQGCTFDNNYSYNFLMETNNTVDDVTEDNILLNICHEDKIKRDLKYEIRCNGIKQDEGTIDQNRFGLCSNGTFRVIEPFTGCEGYSLVNISLNNDAQASNQRHNISSWELDRTVSNHTDTSVDNDVIFNATEVLWQGIHEYESYNHGNINVDINCSHNTESDYDNSTSENVTIVNAPPVISNGVIDLPSGTMYQLNSTNPLVTTVVEFEYGLWNFTVPVADDDMDSHTDTLYNSSGDILWSNSHIGYESIHNLTSNNFTNFVNDNVYNYTVWANDSTGNESQKSFYFNVTDTTIPKFGTIVNQTLVYNNALSYTVNATDDLGISDFVVNDTKFTITSAGVLTNATVLGVLEYYINITVNDSVNNKNSTIMLVNVTQATAQTSLTFNETSSINYTTNLIATCNYITGEGSAILFRDGGDVNATENGVSVLLGVGIYNYDCNMTDTLNYTSASNSSSFEVTQINSTLNLTLGGVESNLSIVNNTQTDLNCSQLTGDTGATLNLYNNGSLINTGPTPSNNYTLFDIVGLYNITCTYPNTQNYTGSSETWYVNVTAVDTELPTFGTNANQSLVFNNPLAIQINATDDIELGNFSVNDTRFDINNSGYLTNATLLGVLEYYINLTVNDTSGNQNSTIMLVNITQATSALNLTLNNTEANITIVNNTNIDLNCSLITGDVGTVLSLFNNGTLINAGTSPGNSTLFNVVGLYNVSCVYNVTQNYTSDRENWFVNVTAGDTELPTFGTNANQSLVFNNPLAIQINATDNIELGNFSVNDSRFDINNSGYLTNGTLLGVLEYYINLTVNDTSGNQNSTIMLVNITRATSVLNLTLNNTESNISIQNDTTIDLNCSLLTGQSGSIISMSNNGTFINAGASPIGNSTLFDAVGLYNISCVLNATQNYTASSENWFVNVTVTNLIPVFNNLRNFTQQANISFSESITATNADFYWLNDTTYFDINNATGLITNVTNLSRIEIHHLNISVNSSTNNITSGLFWINITAVPIAVITGLSIYDMYISYNNELMLPGTAPDEMEFGYNKENEIQEVFNYAK